MIRFTIRILSLFILIIGFKNSNSQVRFEKKLIASESFESVAVFDVDNDGNLDIVSGAYWYKGPYFIERHYIGKVDRTGEGNYWNDFATIPLDVNGDGYVDFVSGDWFSKAVWWRENPGKEDHEWELHLIDTPGNVETIRGWDIDGDGMTEIVPNTPEDSIVFYKLQKNDRRDFDSFMKIVISSVNSHGLGFGDIDGDGVGDFVVSSGWLKAPNHLKGEWKLNDFVFENGARFDLGTASIPILIKDVNADGLKDLIVGQAHDYGLDWYEQARNDSGEIFWRKHTIDSSNSQYHTMEWEDIDGDGMAELITGKRYRAHNGNDPGSDDPYGLYYFKWNGGSFEKNNISFGPFGEGKGTGLYFAVADLRNIGRKDVVVAGKDGLYVFYNQTNN